MLCISPPPLTSHTTADQEAEERQEALDAEKAQKEQLRLQEVSVSHASVSVRSKQHSMPHSHGVEK